MCSPDIQNVSALQVLRNRSLQKTFVYLLAYLLIEARDNAHVYVYKFNNYSATSADK